MVPILFILGVVFAYFVVVPAAIKFLLNFNDDQFNIQIRAREYYSFFSLSLLSVGILFQIPIGILAVTRLGIVTPDQLAANRRYAILIIAVLAMLLPRHRPDHDAALDAAADPALRVQPDRRQGARETVEEGPIRPRASRALRSNRPARLPGMLFELGGKRKRLIQVIYVCLAFLMAVALVGFGIGGATSGGIFDAVGIGGGSSSRPPAVRRADPARRGHAADRSEGREGAADRSPAPTTSPDRPRPRPTTRGGSPSPTRRSRSIATRRRVGAVPGDEAEEAERRRRLADAAALRDARRHRSGPDRGRHRPGLQGGADRRRGATELRHLPAARHLRYPRRRGQGRQGGRAEAPSRRRPTRPRRVRSRPRSPRPSSSARRSRRRSSRPRPTRASCRTRSAGSAAPAPFPAAEKGPGSEPLPSLHGAGPLSLPSPTPGD